MKIVLATGIYPPDIGGPATYVQNLARMLGSSGHIVTVITYDTIFRDLPKGEAWNVIRVSKAGSMFSRWSRYAAAIRQHAKDSDAIVVFSSVSCGIPLWMSGVKRPKKILRLGGDFFWERYTALHGRLGLADWYAVSPWTSITRMLNALLMGRLLRKFDHIVYSTQYQRAIHERHYHSLPAHSVIQNALPASKAVHHEPHTPWRLLYLGRLVGFKNVESLVRAMINLPNAELTITGEGPMLSILKKIANDCGLQNRVAFVRPVLGDDKTKVFADHDLFILPSITEISPNAALEARSAGLPVLLTEATGLSRELTSGMVLQVLSSPADIARAVADAMSRYPEIAKAAATNIAPRTWEDVAGDWQRLLV